MMQQDHERILTALKYCRKSNDRKFHHCNKGRLDCTGSNNISKQ